MRKPVLLILTNTAILIAIFALLSQTLFVVQRVALVGKVEGKASIQRGARGVFEPLTSGMGVKASDIVRTSGASSAEMSWSDGTRWKLLSNSEAALGGASFGDGGKSELFKLHLSVGKVLVRVGRKLSPNSRFEVETPSTLAVTHGQVFSVAINAGFTAVDVFQGMVAVTPLQGGLETIAQPNKRVIEAEDGLASMPVASPIGFENEPDFIKPKLEATVRTLDDRHVLITGQTEADSRVVIDGQDVGSTRNGLFLRRVKAIPGVKSWKVESIDAYGQRNEVAASMGSCPTMQAN